MTFNFGKILLTGRQLEVLHLLARGKTGGNIATHLGISICTVRMHIRNTMQKLDAINIPHAVAKGYMAGILNCINCDSDELIFLEGLSSEKIK